jgi:hypothetical protein
VKREAVRMDLKLFSSWVPRSVGGLDGGVVETGVWAAGSRGSDKRRTAQPVARGGGGHVALLARN